MAFHTNAADARRPNPANLRDFEADKRYKFVKGDVCNERLVESLMSDVDVTVNLAAESSIISKD